MKILFFSKYGNNAASSRYRILQYLPFLDKSNISYDINYLLDDEYVDKLNKTKSGFGLIFKIVFSYLDRIRVVFKCRKYDLIIIQYELFPFFPSFFEYLLAKFNKKYIVDYDDAIFHNYDMHGNFLIKHLFKNKISGVIKNATAVLAGSHYIYNYALRYNSNVFFLPTVVNTSLYNKTPECRKNEFIVGWIGSSSTSKYLVPYVKLFEKLSREGVKFMFIGFYEGYKIYFKDVNIDFLNWSSESEIEQLKSMSVGIMPLDDSPWTKGKCGFKLIQYMASQIPVIATPVGENNYIVCNQKNGFLAKSENDWYSYICFLKENAGLCAEMGQNGFALVEKKYSLEVTNKMFIEILKSQFN